MSFLLDTDICSAYLKGNPAVWNRFMQFSGGLHISAITFAELEVWASRAGAPQRRRQAIDELLGDVVLLNVDASVAKLFGQLQAQLLDRGTPAPAMDLLIAATAMFYNLTLVTHNAQDFANIPDLRMADWLAP